MRKADISPADLTPPQKAAVLVVCLGRDLAAKVLGYLSEEEIEQLTFEMVNLGTISPEVRDHVLEEFRHVVEAQQAITVGGAEYAHQLLAQALGEDKAMEVIDRLTALLKVNPFEFARSADPAQVLSFIQDEHPQTIALILAHLKAEQSAAVLAELPADIQADVARRVATLGRTPPDVVRKVETVLERKMSSLLQEDYALAGGVQALVDILARVDRTTERSIFERLSEQAPELAEEVKNRMFVFEDIVNLDDRTIQQIVMEIDSADLALALKGSSAEVQECVFRNVSARAGERLREDMEYMGPVRVRQVEEAQQRIVNVIRRLEDTGEIVISRGGEDEVIV
ncbi:MAG TPA: flagellar motor switch protein FliG [Armatimonadota bacterium]|mgnify:CR=1 FL=1|nr:flagellar motor switch protein FliG [Armatimonadota bacterium]